MGWVGFSGVGLSFGWVELGWLGWGGVGLSFGWVGLGKVRLG